MKRRYAFFLGALAGLAGGAFVGVWHGRRTAPVRTVEIVKEAPAAKAAGTAPGGEPAQAAVAAKEDRKEGALPLGRREEEPKPEPGDGPQITSDRQALALLASGDEKERGAALAWLRDRLFSATVQEWAELDPLLAAALTGLTPEARADVLNDLFGASGFLLDEPGPALREGRLRDLFFETARAMPAGKDRREILRTLSTQVMAERGLDLVGLLSLLETEPGQETSRLEARSGRPFSEGGAAFLLEEMGAPGRLGLPLEDVEDLLGLVPLATPEATVAERAVLVSWATEHVDPKARAGALLILGGVGTPETTGVLVGVAGDVRKPVSDRVMAYLALRRGGQEGKLSDETRREVIKLWEESGKKEAEDFIED